VIAYASEAKILISPQPPAVTRPVSPVSHAHPPAPRGPVLARIALTDFRCYVRAELAPEPGAVVLTGPNGAGKTNLLEAISFLAPGRGLRRALIGAVDRRPAAAGPAAPAPGPWAVHARLAGPDGPVEIGTGRDPAAPADAPRPRRLVKVDGTFMRGQASLSAHLSVSWLTPQMDRLFLDGAGDRRRFLDRLVYGFDPEHAARVAAFDHALRERARLLRGEVARPDPAWLDALEEQMAARGIAIAAARAALVERLALAAAETAGPFPVPALAMTGTLGTWLAAMPALAAEERLRAALAAGRRQDAAGGGAIAGPHRSDLAVADGRTGMPAAECSTGEQKALLLALVLAHARLQAAERGAPPILLLDEVAAHLDAGRRAALFDELLGLGGQVWLTGTDEALFHPLAGAAQFVRVREARLEEIGR
jgi:DNA replication and repair protein RecF